MEIPKKALKTAKNPNSLHDGDGAQYSVQLLEKARESADTAKIKEELARVDRKIKNLRKALKAGLDDVGWANAELRRLNTECAKLLEQQAKISPRQGPMRVDRSMVDQLRKSFTEVFAGGTPEEKRQYARLFVKKIEVTPDTGDVLMHIFSRHPGISTNRVGGGVTHAVLPHHRAYGSVPRRFMKHM